MLPPDPDLEPLHQREYLVRAWRRDERSILLRGAVMDQRPGEFMAAPIRAAGGDDDGRAMTIHHMVVDLVLGLPGLVVVDAEVIFESFPHGVCPGIASNYRDLIGVSVARGFTGAVRERFGGPRGCTHTTALLQAMAPVALQAMFAFNGNGALTGPPGDPAERAKAAAVMRDTCHVWAEPGDLWQSVLQGASPPMPVTYRRRLGEAGLDPADFGQLLQP